MPGMGRLGHAVPEVLAEANLPARDPRLDRDPPLVNPPGGRQGTLPMRRPVWLLLLVLPLVALVALIVSALQPMQIRAYALGSPDAGQAATLVRGQEACEGPIRVPAAIGGVGIWGNGAGNAQLAVSLRDATTDRVLARGQTTIPPGPPAPHSISVHPSVAAGSMVRVCLTEHGPIPFSLLGSSPTHPEIRMRLGDKLTFSEFSLLLYEPSRHSLLAALPTAFSRAALFRFSWTGPWTFWLLAIALLGTIGCCASALVAATRVDALAEVESETTTEASVPGHPSELAR